MKGSSKFIYVALIAAMIFGFGVVSGADALGQGANGKGFFESEPEEQEEVPKDAEGRAYAAGELIVKYKENVDRGKKAGKRKGLRIRKIREFKRHRMEHLELPPGMSVVEAMERYNADPDVEYAEPNYLVHAQQVPQNIPDDPFLAELWGMLNTGQTGGTPGADIMATEAWDLITGDPNVVVTVIDTGIDYNHEDLIGNLWSNDLESAGDGNLDGCPGVCNVDDDGDGLIDEDSAGNSRYLEDGVTPNTAWLGDMTDDDDENGWIDDIYGINAITGTGDPIDDNGHGTHCAGTIGAFGNNSLGVAGVNWDIQIMACKFLGASGSGYVSDAVACMDYVQTMKDRGVNVIATSNSWGGGGYSQAMYDVITAHMNNDILFVAAAGNNASNNDTNTHYPSGYKIPNVLSVAATDHNDQLVSRDLYSWGSNYGRGTVHLGAPGLDIVSLRAAGTDIYGDGAHFIPDGDPTAKYYKSSGTSMATPHVSGVAALLKAADPSRDWIAIKNLLLSAGDSIPPLADTTITGKRLNAYNSVTCTDSPLISILSGFNIFQAGQLVPITALSINCESSSGPVTVTSSTGGTAELFDDGVSPDQVAGDGLFYGTYTVSTGEETLTVSAPGASDTYTAPLAIYTYSLPMAVVDRPYSATLEARSGVPPYTWEVLNPLPEGLFLDGTTGELYGTPVRFTPRASYSFRVTDSAGSTASTTIRMTVNPPLSIPDSEEIFATLALSFTYNFQASGGAPPYTWTLTGGTLPDGLTLNSNGSLTGTPTVAGPFSFTLSASDGVDAVQRSYSLLVEVVSITTTGLPAGKLDTPYSTTLTGVGGTEPYHWTALSALPPGLTLDAVSGEISGTPTAPGDVTFTLQLADAASNLSVRTFTVSIHEKLTEIWRVPFPTTDSAEVPDTLTSDADGNVYVSGHFHQNGAHWIKTVKYDAAGSELWQANFQTSSCCGGYARGSAIGSNGYLYVFTNGLRRTNILKYDSTDGALVAQNGGILMGGAWYPNDGGLALDDENNVYIAYDDGVSMILVKYDANLNQVWAVAYDAGVTEVAADVTLGLDGSIYVAGWKADEVGRKMLVLKFDVTGNLVWERTFTDSEDRQTVARGIEADPFGGIHVMGTSYMPYAHYEIYNDLFTLTYDSDGNILRILTYNGGGSGMYDRSRQLDLAMDRSGNLYSYGTHLIKYGPTGDGMKFLEEGFRYLIGNGIKADRGPITVTDGTVWVSNSETKEIIKYENLYFRITTTELAAAREGFDYSATLDAINGTAPYSWSELTGGLPAGLTLDETTGVISGATLDVGTVDLVVEVQDVHGIRDSQAFRLSVLPDVPPVIGGEPPISILEDTLYSFTPTASDADGDPLVFSIVNQPSWASFDPATGTLSGTPLNEDVGVTTNIVISVSDTVKTESLQPFDLTVINVNDPPTRTTAGIITYEDTVSGPANITTDDPDVGDTFTYEIITSPAKGTAEVIDNQLIYTSSSVYQGHDTFEFRATDSGGLWVDGTCYVYIYGVNDVPIFNNRPATKALVGSTYSFTPDVFDEENDPLTYSVENLPAWASFDTATGVLSGTPGSADLGSYPGIIITVTDGYDVVSMPAFDVTVYEMAAGWVKQGEGILHNPYGIAVDPNGNVVIVGQNGIEKYAADGALIWSMGTARVVTDVVTDPAGNIITTSYTAFASATTKYDASGALIWEQPYAVAGRAFARGVDVDEFGNVYVAGYVDVAGQFDVFTIKYDSDGNEIWNVLFDNNGLYDAAYDVSVDGSGNVHVTGLVDADTETHRLLTLSYNPDGELRWASMDTLGTHGGPAGHGVVADEAGNVYVAAQQYNLSGAPPWIVKFDTDGNKVWAKDYLAETGSGPFYGIEIDGDGNLYVVGSYNRYDFLTAMLDQDGVMQWMQSYDSTGNDLVNAFALDNCGNIYLTGRAWLNGLWQNQTVKFSMVDQRPVAADGVLTVAEDTAESGTLAASGSSCYPHAFSLVTDGTLGTVTITDPNTGAYTYTPNANANGTDSFTFVADNGLVSNTATVTVTITPVNDAPYTAQDAYSVNEDNVLVIAAPGVLTNDSDVDGDPLTAVLTSDVTNGSLSFNADGSFTYTPDPNYNGLDCFTYDASDSLGGVTNEEVCITVNPVNDAPVISGTPETIVRKNTAYYFAPTASDVDGDTLTFSIVNMPSWASFDTETGILSGTPMAGEITTGIVITVSDGQASASLPAFDLAVNTIDFTKADYNERDETLEVRATTDYGSAAALEVVGFGAMSWHSQSNEWRLTIESLAPADAPTSVTVIGPEGSFTAPVSFD